MFDLAELTLFSLTFYPGYLERQLLEIYSNVRSYDAAVSQSICTTKNNYKKSKMKEKCNFYVLYSYHCHKNECIKIISKVINFVAKFLCVCKLLLLRLLHCSFFTIQKCCTDVIMHDPLIYDSLTWNTYLATLLFIWFREVEIISERYSIFKLLSHNFFMVRLALIAINLLVILYRFFISHYCPFTPFFRGWLLMSTWRKTHIIKFFLNAFLWEIKCTLLMISERALKKL